MEISSRGNSLVKLARSLHEKKFREKEGLFILEGVRLVEEALRAGTPLQAVFHTIRAKNQPRGGKLIDELREAVEELHEVSEPLMEHISPTEAPQGLLALAPLISHRVEQFTLNAAGLYLLVEDLSDPGNLGTIFRTCQAAGVRALLLAGSTCDPLSPKVVRASMGGILTTPFYALRDAQLFLEALRRQGAAIIAATPSGGKPYYSAQYKAPAVLMLGQEARGLSKSMLGLATGQVFIPMEAGVESLNVAISAGILLFHMRRVVQIAQK